jgi:drug/metabolite transporter (DMT)-like permease
MHRGALREHGRGANSCPASRTLPRDGLPAYGSVGLDRESAVDQTRQVAAAGGQAAMRLAAAFLLISAASWAGNHLLARMIAGVVPPASLNALRWALVGIVIAAVSHRTLREDWPAIRSRAGLLTFLGVIGGGIFGTLQFVGLQYTGVINMGVMNSVAPVFIVAASYLLFGDRNGPGQIAGIAVSLLGILAIISQLDTRRLGAFSFNYGDLIILGNMVLWAIYSACQRLIPKIRLESFLFVLAVVSAVTNIPFAAWEHASGQSIPASAVSAIAILYSGLISSMLAYFCWARGVALIGPGRAGSFLHVIPIFNTALGTLVLGEPLRLYHLVGFVFIIAGVSLAVRR